MDRYPSPDELLGCDHEIHVVKFQDSMGRWLFRKQCKKCGRMVESGRFLSYSEVQNKNVPLRDTDLEKRTRNWLKNRYEELRLARMAEWRRDYENHLLSPGWKSLRKLILNRSGGVCEREGCDRMAVHIHHLTYERLGREDLSDLLALCFDCHNEIHGGKLDHG
jgi:hypothetical protein